MPKGKDDLTREETDRGGQQSLRTSRRRWLAITGGTLFGGALGTSVAAADADDHPNVIVFDGTGNRFRSTYKFKVSGEVEKYGDGGTVEDGDTVINKAVVGTVYGDVDTYRFSGNLMYLDVDGPATVSVEYGADSGDESSRLEVVAGESSAVEYEFTTTDRATRVTTNGSNSTDPSDSVDRNDDDSWTVTGDTANGEGDTWDFWGEVSAFEPMDGEFTLFLDGEEITPYELIGEEPLEERTHSYSFEGSGSEPADYFLEVEDGGNMIASTVDGAAIEEEFHWISDDGTKAAGQIDPGERHAYEFDTLVLDVTIEGRADAYVNGSPSNLGRYPQPGATGDGWKSGFPWQDEDDGDDGNDGSETSEDGPIGGGDGYADVVTESDATTVVSSASELASALGSASSGDVVFVDPSAEIDITNTTGVGISDGVTLASTRGVNGSSGALLYTTTDTHPNFEMYGNSRITGLEIRGSHPGDDTSGTWYGQAIKTNGPAEIDNCEIHGWGKAAIECAGSSGGSAHVHHNHLHHNNQIGYGYAVSMISSGGVPTIEYNYFYYNRHSVASDGEASGYTLRYNHFGPTEVMWPIDTHSPGCSTLEIHNNVVEVVDRAYDNNRAASIELDSPPSNSAEIYNNWFFNSRAPDPNDPDPGSPDPAIVMDGGSGWDTIGFWDNYYGEDADCSYEEIIPGYDGWRS